MTLTTPAWPDGDPIPAKYTQAGEQVSPALNWTNTPPGTVSFLLHMHDPDVARNKTTDDSGALAGVEHSGHGDRTYRKACRRARSSPTAAMQISASGPVYRGPGAPATGPQHHYTFEIYALDTKIDVPASADAFETRANIMKAVQGHILGQGRLRRDCSGGRSRRTS